MASSSGPQLEKEMPSHLTFAPHFKAPWPLAQQQHKYFFLHCISVSVALICFSWVFCTRNHITAPFKLWMSNSERNPSVTGDRSLGLAPGDSRWVPWVWTSSLGNSSVLQDPLWPIEKPALGEVPLQPSPSRPELRPCPTLRQDACKQLRATRKF